MRIKEPRKHYKKDPVLHNPLIRKGDKVVVISGNSRGQSGTILMRSSNRAIVQGVNIGTKHVRKSQIDPQGGRRAMERPIHLSNLRLLGEDGKAVKPRVRVTENHKREVVSGRGTEVTVLRSLKNSK